MPDNVAYPNSPTYAEEMKYWSDIQAAQRPRCVALPKCTKDVSLVMSTLGKLQAPFTVKSGGHTAFVGGSNIDDGVTVDLVHLNELHVSDDRKTVSVGPGLRWVDVSRTLDPMNLAVLGGRDADVGISGLLLGGGFSFFSGRHGWAADNVKKFEIVLASGEVTYASPYENRNLYKALRGGGGCSFGIVTRFDLDAYEQGDLWTNTLIFPEETSKQLYEKFQTLVWSGLEEDLDAHTYLVKTKASESDFSTLITFYHAVPPVDDQVPAPFQPFQSLPNASVNATMVSNVTTLSKAISSAYGSRQTWSTLTWRFTSAELLEEISQLWKEAVEKMESAAGSRSVQKHLANQPITKAMITASQKNGGNSMNLSPEDGPLLETHSLVSWKDEALDDTILSINQELIIAMEEATKRHDADHDFVYMNYAGQWQDPLKGYGEESYQNLQQAAAKYDPKGDLKNLWKGYFQV